jgi:hypothetical protein
VDRELEETIKKMERDKKKQLKKERERDAKQDIRTKMSVIATTTIDNDEELTLDKKTWDKLKKIDIEDAHKYIPEESEEDDPMLDPNERQYRFYMDGRQEHPDESGEDEDEDDRLKKVDRMA